MDLVEFKAGLTTRHPWELSRFSFFAKVLGRKGLTSGQQKVLDVGSGDAWFANQMLAQMPSGSELVCWDQGYAEEKVRQAISRLWPTSVTLTAQPPERKFSLVMMMDVLEHVREDRSFLKSIVAQHLESSGHLLISVPAWPQLFSRHDELLDHHRRYRPSQIRALVNESGLQIVQSGGLFGSLLLARTAEVGRKKLIPGAKMNRLEDWRGGKALTGFVKMVLDTDGELGYWLGKAGIDFAGLSWWALCKK